jgi:hypothetical protein
MSEVSKAWWTRTWTWCQWWTASTTAIIYLFAWQHISYRSAPNDLPFSKHPVGKHSNPATEHIVQGAGAKAISLPPIDTISTSCEEMLSRMNLSCGLSRWDLSFRVVASTSQNNTLCVRWTSIQSFFQFANSPAVLMAEYFVWLCFNFSFFSDR